MTTAPSPHLLHHSLLPHIHFPPYTRSEILSIISKEPASIPKLLPSNHDSDDEDRSSTTTPEDLTRLWTRFIAAVWDSLGQSAARDIVSFREVCLRLWPLFTQPIIEGLYGVKEFSKLMVRNRGLFQSEACLLETIVPVAPISGNGNITKGRFCRLDWALGKD